MTELKNTNEYFDFRKDRRSECSDLLPCPFCGDKNVRFLTGSLCDEIFIKTSHPGCEAEVLFFGEDAETKRAVLDTWNKRAR